VRSERYRKKDKKTNFEERTGLTRKESAWPVSLLSEGSYSVIYRE
jgi:hypothetical protein